MSSSSAAPSPTPTIHLTRWTVASGSNIQSRGAVLIGAGDHAWRASAEGIGAIDALYRAVDTALAEILGGHPRLLAWDVHALGEGADTVGVVTVRVAPPAADGARGRGEYEAEARGTNIIAASLEAYLTAINALLAEAHWQGATEAAARTGTRARKRQPVAVGDARARRASLDEDAGGIDTTDWFNQ